MLKSGSLAAAQDRFIQGLREQSVRFPDVRKLQGERLLVWVTALLFFALLGVGLYHQALAPNFPPHHLAHLPLEQEVVLSGRLYRPTRVGPEWVRLYVAAEAWQSPEGWRPATGNLLVSAPPLEAPPLGTMLVVRGKLRKPQALLNPGSRNQPRHLAAEGIFRQMHLNDPNLVNFLSSPEGPALAERLRGGIRRILQEMSPITEAMYLSMLLGDQGKVTQEMRQNLSRTGTSHLLVINGMHLGAVAAVTYFLVFFLLRCFPWLLVRVNAMKVATLAAALPVVAYAHLAGGSPSTQRAEIMVLTYLFLMLLGRFRDVWSALTLAAFLILALNPLLLFTISFQLSFAAVVGIVYLTPRLFKLWRNDKSFTEEGAGWRRWLKQCRRRGGELLIVSFAASLATAPLVAHYFQVVSFFGFLVNVAAIPLVLMMALPLGELAVLAEAFSFTTLAKVLLAIGQVPLNLGYNLIVWVAGLPGSGITVPTPTWLQVALFYILIFLVFSGRRSTWTQVGRALAGAALIFSLAMPSWRSSHAFEVTILDSYSGLDGVLVAPEGQKAAVSAALDDWPGWKGGGLGPLPGYLHWRQVRRLDAVLALKLNARNAQEMLTLVQQFEIGGFWWEGRRASDKVVDLMNLMGDAGRPALSLTRIGPPLDPPTTLGGMSLAYPTWAGGQGVALKITCRGRQGLILPPLKLAVLEELSWTEDTQLAVLVAPGDIPETVVARLNPKILVLYGHREPQAGNAHHSGSAPYWTREGAVNLIFTEQGVTCNQWHP